MPENQSAKKVLNENDLVKYVKDRLSKCKKDPYELQAYLNIAYFAGKQWVAWDKQTNKLFEPAKETWQIRYVANRIQPIVRTELAKTTKNKFTMYVVPATTEDNDIKAARTGEKIVEYLEHELHLQEKDRENCLWGLVTSAGFIKPYWNPKKGLEVSDGVFQGDADVDVVSLFELKWDTSASKWQDVRWICHEKVRDVDDIYATYGVKVAPENDLTVSNIYEAKLQSLNNIGDGVTYRSADNSARVSEYWELPCSKYKHGRRITIVADKVLFYDEDIGFGENDDTDRELPFFPFFHINVPGRVFPTSVVEQLIPIQREYNKSRSQIIENKNLMGNPIWLVPMGCLQEEITNMPGGVYEYNPGLGAKPEIIQPPAMGADVYQNLNFCKEEMSFVAGQSEVANNVLPPGVKSGTAISFLQEQDDTKLASTIQNFISCKQKYMRYLLKMIQKKYDIERQIRIVGSNKQAQVFAFKGSDLTSIDVRVQEASMYQLSRAGRQDLVMQLIQYGAIDPTTPKGQDIVLKVFELGLVDNIYEENEVDTAQAQDEQDKWAKQDLTPIVRDFYNHEIHLKEHNRFRKGETYNAMPIEIKEIIDAHCNEHLSFLLQMQVPMREEQSKAINPKPIKPDITNPQTNLSEV